MRRPRVQFTMRRMMVLVGILAIFLGLGRWAYLRYAGKVVTRGYYVGDLIHPNANRVLSVSKAELNEQAELLKSSVTPEVWWLETGRASVTPVPLSESLLIRHTEHGHQQIGAYFQQRRDRLYNVSKY